MWPSVSLSHTHACTTRQANSHRVTHTHSLTHSHTHSLTQTPTHSKENSPTHTNTPKKNPAQHFRHSITHTKLTHSLTQSQAQTQACDWVSREWVCVSERVRRSLSHSLETHSLTQRLSLCEWVSESCSSEQLRRLGEISTQILFSLNPTSLSPTNSHKLMRVLSISLSPRARSLTGWDLSFYSDLSLYSPVCVSSWVTQSLTNSHIQVSVTYTYIYSSPDLHMHTYIYHLYVWVDEWLTCMCELVCDWDEYVWVGVWLRRTLYLSPPPSPRSLAGSDLSLYSDLSLHSSQSLTNSLGEQNVWVGVWLTCMCELVCDWDE